MDGEAASSGHHHQVQGEPFGPPTVPDDEAHHVIAHRSVRAGRDRERKHPLSVIPPGRCQQACTGRQSSGRDPRQPTASVTIEDGELVLRGVPSGHRGGRGGQGKLSRHVDTPRLDLMPPAEWSRDELTQLMASGASVQARPTLVTETRATGAIQPRRPTPFTHRQPLTACPVPALVTCTEARPVTPGWSASEGLVAQPGARFS